MYMWATCGQAVGCALLNCILVRFLDHQNFDLDVCFRSIDCIARLTLTHPPIDPAKYRNHVCDGTISTQCAPRTIRSSPRTRPPRDQAAHLWCPLCLGRGPCWPLCGTPSFDGPSSTTWPGRREESRSATATAFRWCSAQDARYQ